MSLWSKAVDSLTSEDIDAFLSQGHKEGPRLDYKADIPNDLPKVVAAFANTMGGFIILGVSADPKTNVPVWPPISGSRAMPEAAGIEEKIVATCRDNIYPPLLPQVSRIIANRYLPGHVLAVVRVDESPEAPHAVNGGRHIYERTGNQGKPIDFAHIDRIRHLLSRRRRLDEERERSIQQAIERTVNQLGGRRLHLVQPPGIVGPDEEGEHWMKVPLRWVSVIPFYPWRDLCSLQECYVRHHAQEFLAVQVQRVPGGSLALREAFLDRAKPIGRSILTTKGHVFAIECAHEAQVDYENSTGLGANRRTPEDFWLRFEKTQTFVQQNLRAATQFFEGQVELPGYLQLTVGFLDVRHYRMYRNPTKAEEACSDLIRGARFPDERFRADVIKLASEFLKDPDAVAGELLEQLAYGFDMPWRASQGLARG
jgi:hypothetical protein